MTQNIRRLLFLLFFLSGFCGLVYQVVWTRLAFASFGIIMPVLSVVLSVFMLGLSIGSWVGGRVIPSLTLKTKLSAIFFYAGVEFLIGLSAFAIPELFAFGERILLNSGETDSFHYLCLSALVLAISILPWCIFMGTTFPFMMAFIREQDRENTESFSFLYLANVLGAMSGVLLAAVVLIEVFGFRHTLWVAAAGNFTIALISICLGSRCTPKIIAAEISGAGKTKASSLPRTDQDWLIKGLLFSTGFIAMAMEVIWTRSFTPVLKTQVYSFAMIVFTYLGSTFFGSWMYRRDLGKNSVISLSKLISALAITVLLPVVINNPRLILINYWMYSIDFVSAIILLASICPFCALLGYLTPGLIDKYSAGNPTDAGKAYAINVLGCILGPLLACYVLLPYLSERYSLILLSLPFFVFYWLPGRSQSGRQRWGLPMVMVVALLGSLFSDDYESDLFKTAKNTIVRRDYTASVTSFGEGFDRWLLVNGIGMTKLSPITKFAAHLPLAYHAAAPKSALIICFGMGTTYRSALSWGIEATTVELVPSVTEAFGFYHEDAALFLNNPRGNIVIDDGRRFLARTPKKFDVIIIDPPPPVETAGSSLLLSKEFYALAQKHLNPGGIIQVWFPGGDTLTAQAVLRSISESFPYIRCFPSVEGWGLHILASMEPMEQLTPAQLAARFPENARKDLLEWNPTQDLSTYLGQAVSHEVPPSELQKFLNPNHNVQITDDHPYNEYFLLRQIGGAGNK